MNTWLSRCNGGVVTMINLGFCKLHKMIRIDPTWAFIGLYKLINCPSTYGYDPSFKHSRCIVLGEGRACGSGICYRTLHVGVKVHGGNNMVVPQIFISLRLMPPAFAGLEIASSMARSTTKSSSSNNSTILSIASSMARSTTKSNSNSSNNQQQQ